MDRLKVAGELVRLAKALVAQDEVFGLDETTMKVAEFFKKSPDPDDDAFHKWAEGENLDIHEAEAGAYKLATIAGAFLSEGKANAEGIGKGDVDPDEMKAGIKVEMEHTSSPHMAERIVLDHEAEDSDSPLGYYEGLLIFEKFRGMLAKMDSAEADKKIADFKALVED